MIGTCRLNNKNMRNLRKEAAYQCLAVDLAMLGVISKEECEMLIGSGIPNGLVLPNGKAGNLVSEDKLPEQPVVTEETETEVSDGSETEGTDPVVTEPADGEDPVVTEPADGEDPVVTEPADDEGRAE